jgi:hypothetical protein
MKKNFGECFPKFFSMSFPPQISFIFGGWGTFWKRFPKFFEWEKKFGGWE